MRKTILLAPLFGLLVPALTATAQDKVDFKTQVYPLLKASCIQCHRPEHENPERPGRKIKPKGGYVFTNAEALMAAEVEDGPKFIVAGKPDESRILQVVKLPIDDESHYPPEGKAPQWTKAEIELVSKWITEGADFGDWKEDDTPLEYPVWDGKEKG
jgi:mono/diheme cytochrome c family protein